MVTTFPTMQTAIDARHKRLEWYVLIGGILTDCRDVTTHHSVDDPVGTCTLTLNLPLPAHVQFGALVEVQAGYPGQVHTIFRGKIPKRDRLFDQNGARATLNVPSLGARLNRRDYTDVVFPGPISLRDVFNGLNARRGIESYYADDVTAPDGSTIITLGNTQAANGKTVKVPRKTGFLNFLTAAAELFGYRVYDTPFGVRMKRVSGMPDEAPSLVITEAWNALGAGYLDHIDGLINYWEVFGAKYDDEDGSRAVLRSIPDEVPYDPRLAPEGWARDERSSDLLDTVALCDIVRNVMEIDHSEPYEQVSWTTHGSPSLLPGDVVEVTSSTLAVSGKQWVLSVQHTINTNGFTTKCTGWRGAGIALPAGNDVVATLLRSAPVHLGDEYLSHYAVPSPSVATGSPFKVPFVVLEQYSALTIRARGHGCNSYLIGGKNSDADVSRFELWQFGERVGSGNLPILNEDLDLRRNYLQDQWWSNLVIPITGSIKPGAAELHIISGKDSRIGEAYAYDDFEVKEIWLHTAGAGEPTLPTPTGGA